MYLVFNLVFTGPNRGDVVIIKDDWVFTETNMGDFVNVNDSLVSNEPEV